MMIDPTVKKILNNGYFIAALAPVLASRSSWRPIREAATRLGEVSGAYSKMLAGVGAAARPDGDWEGCAQAKLLMQWIEDDGLVAVVYDRVGEMDAWAAVIWSAIADLAAGKLPPA
jgi:hypothetical protein